MPVLTPGTPEAWKSGRTKTFAATVASGQTESAEVDMKGMTPVGVVIPSTFDGTTIGFSVATGSGGTFYTMLDSTGAAISITAAASRYLPLDPGIFAGVRFLKIVCGTSQSTTSTALLVVGRDMG